MLHKLEALSFSLVCKDRTIDLMCQDLMQVETWIKGLKMLIEDAKSNMGKTPRKTNSVHAEEKSSFASTIFKLFHTEKNVEQPLEQPSTETLALFQHCVHEMKNDTNLIELVVVVSIKELNSEQLDAHISYTYPPLHLQKVDYTGMLKALPMFCFPDLDELQKVELMARYVKLIYWYSQNFKQIVYICINKYGWFAKIWILQANIGSW